MAQREKQIEALENEWAQSARWKGVKRGYCAADVVRLRGSVLRYERPLEPVIDASEWNMNR